MPTADWNDVLAQNKRFVAFVDILGYRSIVTDKGTSDESKAKRLYSAFENVGTAVLNTINDWKQPNPVMPGASATISAISFSDCFYFSSDKLGDLVAFVAHVFANTYGYYAKVYDDDPDCWVPYLRGAVADGWCLNFLDVSLLAKLKQSDGFRNPVGPAIVDAYSLSEVDPKLPGMRIVLSPSCAEALAGTEQQQPIRHRPVKWPSTSLNPQADGTIACDTLNLFPVEKQEHSLQTELWEVDWFTNVIGGNNVDCVDLLGKTHLQFEGEAKKHLGSTLKLARKATILANEPRLTETADEILEKLLEKQRPQGRLLSCLLRRR